MNGWESQRRQGGSFRGCGVKEGPGRKDLRTLKWTGRGTVKGPRERGLWGARTISRCRPSLLPVLREGVKGDRWSVGLESVVRRVSTFEKQDVKYMECTRKFESGETEKAGTVTNNQRRSKWGRVNVHKGLPLTVGVAPAAD